MAFWSDVSVEPKRSYRWLFYLQGDTPNVGIQTYTIKSVKKPSFTISEVPHQYIAHTFYYPGRLTWSPVEVTIVDPVSPDATATLNRVLVNSGYEIPVPNAEMPNRVNQSFSKSKAVLNGLGTPRLVQLDADGRQIEEWSLRNAFLTNVDFGNLDYATEEMLNISLTIRYDYATYSGEPNLDAPFPTLSPVLYE
jgi:hypothetical protein